MLPLNDPLWKKLDDAHRDRDIPRLLSELSEAWDDEAANSLLWDCLCHQETCYGATYAAVPHLLRIAERDSNRHQRLMIAFFAGFVLLCAFRVRRGSVDGIDDGSLPGLPENVEAWDQKLDCFRGLVAIFENPDRRSSHYDYEQAELLPRYRSLLAIEPVNEADLEQIKLIKADFLSTLPTIRATCERALIENLNDKYAVVHLLSGMAAADGLISLASLLSSGWDGLFQCSSCNWCYRYLLLGERLAIYADEERAMLDFGENTSSRSDGFMVPATDTEVVDHRAAALLSLARRALSPEPTLLLCGFLGTVPCCKCGAQTPIRAFASLTD